MIYHTGYLAYDRSDYTTDAKGNNIYAFPKLDGLADKAYADYMAKKVILIQRKISGLAGPKKLPIYEYHAIPI